MQDSNQMEKTPKYPVKTIIKAIEIINYLAQDTSNTGIGVSEFSRMLNMGKSTVHRILETLQTYGYIEKDETLNQYRLGWELYKIGQAIPRQNQLLNLSPSHMAKLSKTTRETVSLAILNRNETVIISKIEGSYDGLRVNLNPGEYESTHATALGKVLICEKDELTLRELFKGKIVLPEYTPNTIVNIADLLIEKERVSKQGYAEDIEEYCNGVHCIAMPVRDYTQQIIAAVSVSTPVGRMDAEKRSLILEALSQCTKEISRNLGYSVV